MKRAGVLSKLAIKTLFKRPATVPYLGGAFTVDERCRGLIQYDPTECIACGLCMRDCPTGALSVVNKGTRTEKDMDAHLDLGRCIFCGQCADSCNKHCITVTSQADLAQLTKDGLIIKL